MQPEELGTLKISDEVIATCASQAVKEIKGIYQLTGGLTESLSKNILGIDYSNKGIKISRNDFGITLDIYIIVEYMTKIPQLAWETQSKVKEEIENMTDLKVQAVNIHVQGVHLQGEEEE